MWFFLKLFSCTVHLAKYLITKTEYKYSVQYYQNVRMIFLIDQMYNFDEI